MKQRELKIILLTSPKFSKYIYSFRKIQIIIENIYFWRSRHELLNNDTMTIDKKYVFFRHIKIWR
jgi:hypothetical protein